VTSFGQSPVLTFRPTPQVAWRVVPLDVVLLSAVLMLSSVAVWQTTLTGQVPEHLQGPLSAAWSVRSGQPVQFDGPPLLAILLVPLAQGSEALCLPAGLVMVVWCVVNGVLLWLCYRLLSYRYQGERLGVRRLPQWYALLLVPGLLSLSHGGQTTLALWLALQLDAAMEEGEAFPAGLWFAALLIVQPLALLLLLALQPGKTLQLATFVGLLLGCVVLPGMLLGLHETSRLNRHYLEVIQLQLFTWPTLGLAGLVFITMLYSREARLERLRVMALALSTGGLVNLLNLAVWLVSWIKVTPMVAKVSVTENTDVAPFSKAA
jgi:hypothetical protein